MRVAAARVFMRYLDDRKILLKSVTPPTSRAFERNGQHRKSLSRWTAFIALDRSGRRLDYARKTRKRLLRVESLQSVTEATG
jgi:hypothetical protein